MCTEPFQQCVQRSCKLLLLAFVFKLSIQFSSFPSSVSRLSMTSIFSDLPSLFSSTHFLTLQDVPKHVRESGYCRWPICC